MKQFGIAVAALLLAAAPASAQYGGGGFHGGGGFRGGFGFRGGHVGPRFGFGFGCCGGFYAPYYDSFWWPYDYGASYYPYYPYYDYGYDYGAPPPPDAQGYDAPPPPDADAQSPWHVTQRDGETDFELPDDVLFNLGSAHVAPDADRVLQEIADTANDQRGAQLVVEGHTDTSGTHEHNQALSDARARAVADVLVHEGVARDRIRTEGMGEAGLAVQTAEGVREPRNRRVVVRLINSNMAAGGAESGPDQGPN